MARHADDCPELQNEDPAPPGTDAGGPGALSRTLDQYWTVRLEPGNYLFVCFVPDSADGAPHLMKGMVREFTVSAS